MHGLIWPKSCRSSGTGLGDGFGTSVNKMPSLGVDKKGYGEGHGSSSIMVAQLHILGHVTPRKAYPCQDHSRNIQREREQAQYTREKTRLLIFMLSSTLRTSNWYCVET